MKKHKSLLITLCALLSFSCSASKMDREGKALIRKVENIDSLVMLRSVAELNSVARYEDAIIFVTKEGCKYCEAQRELLKEYISNTESLFYEVDIYTYFEAFDSTENQVGEYKNLYPKVTGVPFTMTYSEGKLLDAHQGALSNTYDQLVNDLNTMIIPVNVYQINDFVLGSDGRYYFESTESVEEAKNQETIGFGTKALDEKIASKEKIAIYFTWHKCGDCKNYRNDVFNDFILTYTNVKLYQYEVDGYYTLKRNTDPSISNIGLKMWSDFSIKYGLITDSFYNEDINGDKAGFVPAISVFENGKKVALDVFANEGNIFRNENGTLSFGRYFNQEVKNVKSNTKVESGDTASETYMKAVKEIYQSAYDIDVKASKEFLNKKV